MPIIKVKDYSGAERAYDTSQCKDTLLLPLADGSGNVPFSYGVTASETVALDFSGGDMTITPAAGQVLSGLTIPKPETLIPENIKEGVNIAGILGTLAAGGETKVETGKFANDLSGTMFTVTHSLGAVPDLVLAICSPQAINLTGAYILIGYSTNFAKKIGHSDVPQRTVFIQKDTTPLASGAWYPIDYDQLTTTEKYITATAQSITFGNASTDRQISLTTLARGYWIAISGLA